MIGRFGVRTPSSMARHVAQKMYWLCGLPPPRMLGGQAWPGNPHYGFEQAEGGGNPLLGGVGLALGLDATAEGGKLAALEAKVDKLSTQLEALTQALRSPRPNL